MMRPFKIKTISRCRQREPEHRDPREAIRDCPLRDQHLTRGEVLGHESQEPALGSVPGDHWQGETEGDLRLGQGVWKE